MMPSKGLKGFASAMKPKGPTPFAAPMKEEADESSPDSEAGGSELEFAKIASEASAAGDHDAAAKAMVSAIKACMGSDYSSEE